MDSIHGIYICIYGIYHTGLPSPPQNIISCADGVIFIYVSSAANINIIEINKYKYKNINIIEINKYKYKSIIIVVVRGQ